MECTRKHTGELENSQPVTFAPLSMMEVLRTESDFLSQFLIDKLLQKELNYVESMNVIAFLYYFLISVSAEQKVYVQKGKSAVCFFPRHTPTVHPLNIEMYVFFLKN